MTQERQRLPLSWLPADSAATMFALLRRHSHAGIVRSDSERRFFHLFPGPLTDCVTLIFYLPPVVLGVGLRHCTGTLQVAP
jgi:hypothetical protein